MTRIRAFVRYGDRALWLAALIILGAGYYTAFAFVNAAIDVQNRLTARVTGSLRANARTLAQHPLSAHEVAMLATHLREFDHADKPTSVARFISIATRIGARRAVRIIGIDAREATPADAGPTVPLDVTLRGSYRALLATIRDLGQAPLVMRVDVTAIESATGAGGESANDPLIARVRVVLERLADGPPRAPARPDARPF